MLSMHYCMINKYNKSACSRR
uniref:Uncharacterized protein n=1 Tax=Rhizophora mucronata TaxID=61149 RepID=A0A2P2PQP7_RHIMU